MKSHILVQFLMTYCLLKVTATAKEDGDDLISLLLDVLTFQKLRTYVTAFLCSDKDAMIKFLVTLSVSGYASEVRTSCNASEFHFRDSNTMFLLDLQCSFSEDCLQMAESSSLFQAPHRWLFIDSNFKAKTNSIINLNKLNMSNTESIDMQEANITDTVLNTEVQMLPYTEHKKGFISEFDKYSILCDSNVLLAKQENDQFYNITKFYKVSHSSKLIVDFSGTWRRDLGLMLPTPEAIVVPAVRRINLQGTPIRASVVITDNGTLNHLDDFRQKHVDALSKVNYLITSELMDTLNATRQFVFESTWGYRTEDGWSGMIGKLHRREAELGGTPLFMTPDRLPIIEYISMTTPTVTTFVFRQPQLSYVSNIFLLPFHWSVWYASAGLVALGILALAVSSRWENKHPSEKDLPPCKECGSESNKMSGVGEVCMLAVGAVTQQGSTTEPHALSGRIISILLLVVLMFLYTSYSANIVALLQSPSGSIKTLSDLLQSKISLGVDDTVYNRYYFPRASEPLQKAIWDQKISPKGSSPHYMKLVDGVKRMRQGLFAFHFETGPGYTVVGDLFQEHEKCGLREIPFLKMTNPWYCIQKNSSYRELFRIGMRRIQEAGIQPRIVSRLYTKKPSCTAKGSNFVSVGLGDVRPALLWLAWGWVVAAGMLVFEIFLKSERVSKLLAFGKMRKTKKQFDNKLYDD